MRYIVITFGSMNDMSQHYYNSMSDTAQAFLLFSLLSVWERIYTIFSVPSQRIGLVNYVSRCVR